MKKTKKGFTLVELVIVIAVIAILASVLIPTFSGILQRAKENSNMQRAITVRDEYYSSNEKIVTIENMYDFIIEVNGSYYKVGTNGTLELIPMTMVESTMEAYESVDETLSGAVVYKPIEVEVITTSVGYDSVTQTTYTFDEMVQQNILVFEENYQYNYYYYDSTLDTYVQGSTNYRKTILAGEHIDYIDSLTVGNEVESIGRLSYYYWSDPNDYSNNIYTRARLTELKIGSTVVTIIDGDYMSSNQYSNIVIAPDSHLEYIGSYAFAGSIIEEITLPASVTNIGDNIFSGCSHLTTINYPSSMYNMLYNKNAFTGTGVSSITIPEGTTVIESGKFSGCSNLTSITIPSSVTTIENSAFSNSGLVTITIPATVNSIGQSAFYNCQNLETVVLPDNITTIENATFQKCSSLTNITMNGVTTINNYAFCESGLVDLVMPANLSTIGEWVFQDMTSLETITFSTSITEIKHCSFMGCTSLESVSLPNNITKVGSYAFSGCVSLSSVNLNRVTILDSYAFKDCSSLRELELPNTLTTIYSYVFHGCAIEHLTIPSSVTSINAGFMYARNLQTITFTNNNVSFEARGNYMFYECNSLQSVILPSSCSNIGYGMFYNCTSLVSVKFSANVTRIENEAFNNCTALQTVYYSGSSSQYNSITKSSGNTALNNATKVYNSSY